MNCALGVRAFLWTALVLWILRPLLSDGPGLSFNETDPRDGLQSVLRLTANGVGISVPVAWHAGSWNSFVVVLNLCGGLPCEGAYLHITFNNNQGLGDVEVADCQESSNSSAYKCLIRPWMLGNFTMTVTAAPVWSWRRVAGRLWFRTGSTLAWRAPVLVSSWHQLQWGTETVLRKCDATDVGEPGTWMGIVPGYVIPSRNCVLETQFTDMEVRKCLHRRLVGFVGDSSLEEMMDALLYRLGVFTGSSARLANQRVGAPQHTTLAMVWNGGWAPTINYVGLPTFRNVSYVRTLRERLTCRGCEQTLIVLHSTCHDLVRMTNVSFAIENISTYETDLRHAVHVLRKMLPTARLAIRSGPVPSRQYRHELVRMQMLNAMARRVARTEGVQYIDVFTPMLRHAGCSETDGHHWVRVQNIRNRDSFANDLRMRYKTKDIFSHGKYTYLFGAEKALSYLAALYSWMCRD